MSDFTSLITRNLLQKSYEGSQLQSPREPGSLGHDWQRIGGNTRRDDSINNVLGALQRKTSRATRPDQALSQLHPFKVYQFPDFMRTFVPANAPQRWKVRGGSFVSEAGLAFAALPGSDGILDFDAQTLLLSTDEVPPDDGTLISDTWHEFVVPQDGTPYYVWASLCLNTETSSEGLLFGNNNTTALSLQSGNTVNDPWPTFPVPDPYHWLIASMTGTAGASYQNSQFVIDNLLNNRVNGGVASRMPMYFTGPYDSTRHYFVGDVVQEGTIGSGNNLFEYLYWPSSSSTYKLSNGPIINIDPTTHTPDPWLLFSVGLQP